MIYDGFWRFFEVHLILAQYQITKPQNPSSEDNGASFDTPGVPWGVQVSNEMNTYI